MLARGDIRRLMVLEPPGHGKTLQCSVHFPAWLLGRQDESIIGAAYNLTKATAESRKLQALLGTARYQAVYPRVRIPARSDVKRGLKVAVDEFTLIDRPRAAYRACGIGTALTGFDKTLGIIDDPIKDQADAQSEVLRERAWDWYGSTYRTRDREVIAGEAGVRDLLVLTPWHEDDLHGRILETEGDSWHVLRLPAFLTDGTSADRDQDDPREVMEALWPEGSWNIEKLLEFQRLRPDLFQALFQCRPTSEGGNLFKRHQFSNRFARGDISSRTGQWFVSVDAAFKGDETSSYVAMQVWCLDYDQKRAYLVHAQREHMDFTASVAGVKALLALFPQCAEVMIEAKANGDAILNTLHAQVGQICTAYNPGNRSKVARALAISPWVAAGCVWLPSDAPWVEEFLGDILKFPKGKISDPVDAMSQALTKMSECAIPGASAWGPILRR